MGSGQSARRVTLDNPDPHDLNNVIKVSDRVVQRLKSTRGTEPVKLVSDNKKSSNKANQLDEEEHHKSAMYGSPGYVQEEIEKINNYWENRMRAMNEGHERMNNIMVEEYAKAQVEVDKLLPRIIPASAKVPCEDSKKKIASCFKKNSKESLLCLKEVEDFKQCISEARKENQAIDEKEEEELSDHCQKMIIMDEFQKELQQREKELMQEEKKKGKK